MFKYMIAIMIFVVISGMTIKSSTYREIAYCVSSGYEYIDGDCVKR